MEVCPCGSSLAYGECCEPYISGREAAPSAEALMRARYTAYVNAAMDFIFESIDPDQRSDYDEAGAREWAESSEWHGLEILAKEKGEEGDNEGSVEFVAHFSQNAKRFLHHERALFKKAEDGRWYFYDGEAVAPQPYKREGVKVGRNEVCPCGSGKKYKKCCLNNA